MPAKPVIDENTALCRACSVARLYVGYYCTPDGLAARSANNQLAKGWLESVVASDEKDAP